MLLAVLMLLGCTSAQIETEAAGERRVSFVCGNGDNVEMRFFPLRREAVLVRHGEAIKLQQQPSGSGFIYSNGPNTVRGKGEEIMIEIGRMVPIKCQAR